MIIALIFINYFVSLTVKWSLLVIIISESIESFLQSSLPASS